MGKFVITKRTNGEFQFVLQTGNGQTILSSEGYSALTGCTNGIESVKANSQDDSKYDRKTSSNGKPYFNLKAGNGQVIGTSQMYADTIGMENGIGSVKHNAPGAETDDQA